MLGRSAISSNALLVWEKQVFPSNESNRMKPPPLLTPPQLPKARLGLYAGAQVSPGKPPGVRSR